MGEENRVWQTKLDGRYRIAVHRVRPYEGELTIADGENVLHRQEVTLSYNAIFGPDVADVAEWEEIAVRFVDGAGS